MANTFFDVKSKHKLLGQLFGAASTCWTEDGVFMSERASQLVDEAYERLSELESEEISVDTKREEIRVLSEEILLDTNQAIRVQALDMSVRSIVPAENFGNMERYTDKFINRAEMFENYIREGVIHNG